jgi:hypothetical protein
MDEGGAAIMLLKLVQFQEAYVVQGNFRKKLFSRQNKLTRNWNPPKIIVC